MSDTEILVHLTAVKKAVEEFEGNLTFGEFGVRLHGEGFVTHGINQIAHQLNDALEEQSDGAERLT